MFFLLPESLPPEKRQSAGERRRRNGGMRTVVLAIRSPLGFIMIMAFLASFATANLEGTFALFTQIGLGFGEGELGVVFGVMGITMALTQGLLVGPALNRWGEPRMIQNGLVASAVGYVTLLFAVDLMSVIIIMVIMGIGNASMRPAINSLVSKRTPPSEQGSMMGVVNSYNSLGRIFGPIAGGLLFDYLGYQSPFIGGSLIFIVTFLLSIPLFRHDRDTQAARKAAQASL
jgi:MFS family permease